MELSRVLGVLSPVNNEIVRDMGLVTLQSCRDKAKLKWWHKLATLILPDDGTLSSRLIRSGILNYIGEGRGKYGVGWWMISLNH